MQASNSTIAKPVVTALQTANITTVAAGPTIYVKPQFNTMTVVMTNTGTSRTVVVQISYNNGTTWYDAATVTAAGNTAVSVPAAPCVRVNQTAVSSSTLSGAKVYA